MSAAGNAANKDHREMKQDRLQTVLRSLFCTCMIASSLPLGQNVRFAGMGYVNLDSYRKGIAASGWMPAVQTGAVPAVSGFQQVRYRPNLNLHFEGELAGLATTALRIGLENDMPKFFSGFQSLPAKDGKGLNAKRGDGRVSKVYVIQSDDGMSTEIILTYTDKASGTGWAFRTTADGRLRQTLFLTATVADRNKLQGQLVNPTPESEEFFKAEKQFWLNRLAAIKGSR
jgi:hypothetical protein